MFRFKTKSLLSSNAIKRSILILFSTNLVKAIIRWAKDFKFQSCSNTPTLRYEDQPPLLGTGKIEASIRSLTPNYTLPSTRDPT